MQSTESDLKEFETLCFLYDTCNVPARGKMSPGMVQLLFASGRVDIIEWTQPEYLDLPEAIEEIADLIMKIPQKSVKPVARWLTRMFPTRIKEIFTTMSTRDGLTPLLVMRSLMRTKDFWNDVDEAVSCIEDSVIDNERICKLILVGHDDPETVTFIEEVLLQFYEDSRCAAVCAIELLISGDGVEGGFAKAAFVRHEYLISSSARRQLISDLMGVVLENTAGNLLTWFLSKLSPYLSPQFYQLLYGKAMTQHCINVEMTADSHQFLQQLVQYSLSTEITIDAESSEVAEYARWLIKNGRVRQLKSSVMVSLVKILAETDLSTTKKLIFSYCLAEPVHVIAFLRVILRDPVCSLDLLDILGEAGMLSSTGGKVALLSCGIGTEKIAHAFEVSVYRQSHGKTAAVNSLLTLSRETTSVDPIKVIELISHMTIEPSQRLNILSFLVDFSEGITTARYNLRHNTEVRYREFIADTLLSDLSDCVPHTAAEIAQILCRYCHEELMFKFRARFRDNLPLLEAFDRSANLVLQRLADTAANAAVEENTRHLYDRCGELISLLGTKAIIIPQVLEPLVKRTSLSMKLCSSLLSVLAALDREPSMLNLADQCLKSTYIISRVEGQTTAVKYASLVGPATCKEILKSLRYMTIPPEFRDKVAKYCSTNLGDYLEALIECWIYNSSVIFLSTLRDDIKVEHHLLTVRTRRYKRPMTLAAPVMLQEIIDGQKFICRGCSCEIPSVDGVFIDERDGFGIYNCKPCSEFFLDVHVSQLTCPVCFGDKDLHIIECGHVYCGECLARFIDSDITKCPHCREDISMEKIRLVSVGDVIRLFVEGCP